MEVHISEVPSTPIILESSSENQKHFSSKLEEDLDATQAISSFPSLSTANLTGIRTNLNSEAENSDSITLSETRDQQC